MNLQKIVLMEGRFNIPASNFDESNFEAGNHLISKRVEKVMVVLNEKLISNE